MTKIEASKELHVYLQKCTIEFIASHGGGIPSVLEGLSAGDIEACLRDLGFRIKEHFYADSPWLRTTNGISVSLDDGFCIKSTK